jgi:Flp pilus assembly protein TadG
MKRRNSRRGSSMLEFAFTGVPLIFVWLSIVQIALGMWHYHTMQYAVKVAGNYLSQHGSDCGGANSCTTTIEGLAAILKTNAMGLPATAMNMTFKSVSGTDHTTALTTVTCLLTDPTVPANGCDQNTTQWLPTTNNAPGSEFEILAKYQWSPMIGIVTPGAGQSFTFAKFWFPAYTHQTTIF